MEAMIKFLDVLNCRLDMELWSLKNCSINFAVFSWSPKSKGILGWAKLSTKLFEYVHLLFFNVC